MFVTKLYSRSRDKLVSDSVNRFDVHRLRGIPLQLRPQPRHVVVDSAAGRVRFKTPYLVQQIVARYDFVRTRRQKTQDGELSLRVISMDSPSRRAIVATKIDLGIAETQFVGQIGAGLAAPE
jgi:hypothetical protein